MIHIIVGDEAAKNLEAACLLDENLTGEIVVLKDTLGLGPLALEEDKDHDAMRSQFWNTVQSYSEIQVEDRTQIKLLIAKAAREEEPVCYWMSACVTDVSAYFWILTYFKEMPSMLHTINIIGLPFLNEKGQLFYPSNFSEVLPKEFLKTKRLLKEVTAAEYEVDGDEWAKLQQENTWVRIYEGGKKLVSKDVSYFDHLLKNALTEEFQKGSRIVSEAMKKCNQTLSHFFLEYRLKQLILEEAIEVNGDVSKATKDFEVRKIGSIATKDLVEETI